MKIIDYPIKAIFIDEKQSRSTIKVPFKERKKVKEALDSGKKLKVTIEVIEENE